MFIYNQIIICQEIIGSQPSVLCTNGKVYQKIDFQLVWLFRSGIMRKNIFVTHNHYVYSSKGEVQPAACVCGCVVGKHPYIPQMAADIIYS